MAVAQEVTLSFITDPEHEKFGQVTFHLPINIPFEISKDIRWHEFFSIKVDNKIESTFTTPNMAGDYRFTENSLLFMPRFPPVPEQHYNVLFNADLFTKKFTTNFRFKQSTYSQRFYIDTPNFKPTTQVSKILPLAHIVPQNILKFYVYFSEPMSMEDPLKYITITDDNGVVINDAFVRVPEGLWDQQKTRLTLFVHPGRIKRGVGLNIKKGMVFQKGMRYQINVNKNFKDYRGVTLVSNITKVFSVSQSIYQTLSPENWTLILPDVQSEQSLIIEPERILEPVLAKKMIHVVNKKTGRKVSGSIEVDSLASTLTFKPKTAWVPGKYELIVDDRLEDLAGNTTTALFDEDISKKQSKHQGTPIIFEI
jgi:hypothetical protein